jgi:hypothetical protein
MTVLMMHTKRCSLLGFWCVLAHDYTADFCLPTIITLVRGDVRIAIGWASPCKFIEADSMLTVMSMVVQRGFPLKLSVTVDFQRSSPEVASLFAGIFV